jgi:hypothetical protein
MPVPPLKPPFSPQKHQERDRQNREKERAMNTFECIQSKQACYDAAIQSEEKPTNRGSSDAECTQSVPGSKPPFSQQKKQERERASNEYNRMHSSVEESLLRSRHSVGSETDTALGRERASTREGLIESERERESERWWLES